MFREIKGTFTLRQLCVGKREIVKTIKINFVYFKMNNEKKLHLNK